MPPFLRAYTCVPGGDDKALAALSVFEHATATGAKPRQTSLDRIYTAQAAERLEHVARDTGWALIKDLKKDQRTVKQHSTGVWYIDGWWFSSGIQPGLLEIPRPPERGSNEQRSKSQARFDARRPYSFRTNGTTSSGNLRLRGPAIPDRVQKDDRDQITKVIGMRVRCINSPYYRFASRDIPETDCTLGVSCGCSITLTIKAGEIPNSIEPTLWGSTKWAASYYRRNLVEAHNSAEEYHQRVGRHSIRVRANKWDFAHLLLAAATLLKTFYNLIMRLGAHALDPAAYSAFNPEVITACLARVTTAEKTEGTSPRSG